MPTPLFYTERYSLHLGDRARHKKSIFQLLSFNAYVKKPTTDTAFRLCGLLVMLFFCFFFFIQQHGMTQFEIECRCGGHSVTK